jgi:hypothetical protein
MKKDNAFSNEKSPKRLADLKPGVDYADPKHYLLRGFPDQVNRLEFLKACERLDIPHEKWPNFGTVDLPGGVEQSPGTAPMSFNTMGAFAKQLTIALPVFDLCDDDHRSWKKKVDQAWMTFRKEKFGPHLKKCVKAQRLAVQMGLLVPRRKTRLGGSIPLNDRYELAARRYCLKESWATLKKMYGDVNSLARIRKSVANTLARVGLIEI